MKTIILTGGSRGLGLAHARYLAERSYNLALVDISRGAADVYGETKDVDNLLGELRRQGNDVRFYECDLTDYARVQKTFQRIVEDFGAVYGLVCNAGGDVSGADARASGGKAANNSIAISLENHDQIFDRNYRTTLNCIKAIVPYFKEQRRGKIVTTASVSATFGVEQETAYAVAKAAVAHLSRCVARELRPFNVNVNCIAPAGTMTGRFMATLASRSKEDQEKILSQAESPLCRPATPEAISSVLEFFLSEASSYVSGQLLRIDGGQFTSPA